MCERSTGSSAPTERKTFYSPVGEIEQTHMSNTRNTIVSNIFNVNSLDDLRYIQNAVRQRWGELESRGTLNFRVGNSVKFTSRNGTILTGIVVKVNRKTISVRVDNVVWRVTPSLLSPLHENASV